MQIAASTLSFQARHHTVERHETREALRVWKEPAPAPQVEPAEITAGSAETATAGSVDEMKFLLIRLLVEHLTGRKLELVDEKIIGRCENIPPVPATAGQGRPASPTPAWGATYDRVESHYEAESTQVSAAGLVRTADGREIAISVALTMSREFMTQNEIHLRAGAAALKDPLVINFTGNAAQLTGDRLDFDLDVDRVQESLPMLAGGSAYLVLDRNGDGAVNDGQELFGPATGEGFAELAQFDEDGNGWIDEGDAVFGQLRLWWHDPATGSDYLWTLQEKNVGAIHLQAVASPFKLMASGEQLGAVRSTGVYLTEEGGAGTVQQIDVKA